MSYLSKNKMSLEILACLGKNIVKNDVVPHVVSSPPGLTHNLTYFELSFLLEQIKNYKKSQKQIKMFLDLITIPKIDRPVSFSPYNSSDLLLNKHLFSNILIKGGQQQKRCSRLIAYLKKLIKKYGKLSFLLLLLAIAIQNRKSIISFLEQLPDLVDKFITFIKNFKNKKNLKGINDFTDIIGETVKEETFDPIQDISESNPLEISKDVLENLDLLKSIPLNFENETLDQICHHLIQENSSEAYKNCLEEVVKLLVYRKCHNTAVSACQQEVATFYNKLIETQCNRINDLFQKNECISNLIQLAILKVFQKCLTSKYILNCGKRYYKLMEDALKKV